MSTVCSDCHKKADDQIHADRNRKGHLFNPGKPLISDRPDLEQPVQSPKSHKPLVEGPRVPSAFDSKWWVRSYKRQSIIRALCMNRLDLHEVAIEQTALSPEPDPDLAEMVLAPDLAEELREIVDVLTRKIEVRKRIKA